MSLRKKHKYSLIMSQYQDLLATLFVMEKKKEESKPLECSLIKDYVNQKCYVQNGKYCLNLKTRRSLYSIGMV